MHTHKHTHTHGYIKALLLYRSWCVCRLQEGGFMTLLDRIRWRRDRKWVEGGTVYKAPRPDSKQRHHNYAESVWNPFNTRTLQSLSFVRSKRLRSSSCEHIWKAAAMALMKLSLFYHTHNFPGLYKIMMNTLSDEPSHPSSFFCRVWVTVWAETRLLQGPQGSSALHSQANQVIKINLQFKTTPDSWSQLTWKRETCWRLVTLLCPVLTSVSVATCRIHI